MANSAQNFFREIFQHFPGHLKQAFLFLHYNLLCSSHQMSSPPESKLNYSVFFFPFPFPFFLSPFPPFFPFSFFPPFLLFPFFLFLFLSVSEIRAFTLSLNRANFLARPLLSIFRVVHWSAESIETTNPKNMNNDSGTDANCGCNYLNFTNCIKGVSLGECQCVFLCKK